VRHLLEKLGFLINKEKSIVTPTRQLQFLGYNFDSKSMRITLPTDKVTKVTNAALALTHAVSHTIQQVAETVGLFIAYCEASDAGRLHYRALEQDKIRGLKAAFGNFSSTMSISREGWQDVQWWLKNAPSMYKTIYRKVPTLTITSDTSLLGWGGPFSGGGNWGQMVSA
jgi:hypothetical protein